MGGCFVKHTVYVPVSAKMLAAKTATLPELVESLSRQSEKIQSLSSSTLKVSFTSGKTESGKLQAYHSAPGYILLKRPDSIRLNVQNPITKTSLLELLSVGDPFSLWWPRDNKFFTGKNSTREFDLTGHPDFTARASHIFEAIIPQKIPTEAPDHYVAMEEDQDAVTKYYVLSEYVKLGPGILRPVRKLWIDRSDLAVSRQQSYDESGRMASSIKYGRMHQVGELLLPLSIRIERPLDGYTLDLEFADWRLNPDLPANAFVLKPPPGAQIVELKDGGRDGKP